MIVRVEVGLLHLARRRLRGLGERLAAPRRSTGSCSGPLISRASTTARRFGRAAAGSRRSARSAAGPVGSRTGTSARRSAPSAAPNASSSCSVSAGSIAPAAMPQLDGDRVIAEALQQPLQVLARVRLVLEAGRKLREQRAQLAGVGQRIDCRAELVDVLLAEVHGIAAGRLVEHLRVRELLIELQRELEARRRALGPPCAPSPAPGRRRRSS